MFGGMGKTFWDLRVSFLKYKGIQAQNVQASVPEPPISHYFE